jgi:hypothetical protein
MISKLMESREQAIVEQKSEEIRITLRFNRSDVRLAAILAGIEQIQLDTAIKSAPEVCIELLEEAVALYQQQLA